MKLCRSLWISGAVHAQTGIYRYGSAAWTGRLLPGRESGTSTVSQLEIPFILLDTVQMDFRKDASVGADCCFQESRPESWPCNYRSECGVTRSAHEAN